MDKEQSAIERIRYLSDATLAAYGRPLVAAYSGGKDSDTLLELVRRAGVPFILEHSHTTADAPQTVYHTRDMLHRLEDEGVPCRVQYPRYKKKRTTLWAVIPEKGTPPTRLIRYCCKILKQEGSRESVVLTGVRWAESARRKNTRGFFEKNAQDIDKRVILREDTEETRQQFDSIMRETSLVTANPLADWTDADIWDFCLSERIPMNPLYQMGFSRVGCIGCPMGGKKRWREFAVFPAFERMYKRAFEKMVEARKQRSLSNRIGWETAEDVFRWWMEDSNVAGQISLEEILNEEVDTHKR